MSFPKAVNILVAILFPRGPACCSLDFQITTCFPRVLENGLVAVAGVGGMRGWGEKLEGCSTGIDKLTAPAVLSHCFLDVASVTNIMVNDSLGQNQMQ